MSHQPTKAYSYLRFSSSRQEEGDSLTRQKTARDEWLQEQKGNVVLDQELTDRAISGFKKRSSRRKQAVGTQKHQVEGKNFDADTSLGRFLGCVYEGQIEPGSYFILDTLDRFSRDETTRVAALLLEMVVRYQIKVVVLQPRRLVLTDRSSAEDITTAVNWLAMAHDYSDALSKKIKSSWKRIRKEAIEQDRKNTQNYPAWLTLENNQFKVKPAARKAIDLIFKRTLEGVPQKLIARELNEKFEPITKRDKRTGKYWSPTYLSKLTKDRRLLGEFQFMKLNEERQLVPEGPLLEQYYPQIIDEETFYAAQAAKAKNKQVSRKKDVPELTNLFRGLVYCSTDGYPMFVQTGYNQPKKDGQKYHYKRLQSYGRNITKDYCRLTINYEAFEELMLAMLHETRAKDIAGSKKRKLVVEQTRSVIDGIAQKIEKLSKLIEDPEWTDELEDNIRLRRKLRNLLDEKQAELKSLETVETKTPAEEARELRQITTPKQRRTEDERERLSWVIHRIVERIELTPVKLKNRRVAAIGTVLLRSKKKRFFILKDLEPANELAVYSKTKEPIIFYSKFGIIYFETTDGTNRHDLTKTLLALPKHHPGWHRFVPADLLQFHGELDEGKTSDGKNVFLATVDDEAANRENTGKTIGKIRTERLEREQQWLNEMAQGMRRRATQQTSASSRQAQQD